MEKYSDEVIKEIRNSISKGEYGLSTKIKDLEVWFWGDTLEEISDEMIEFALDIVNAYQDNKEKYDGKVLEEVKNRLGAVAEVNDSTMLAQLGTPIVDVATGNGASLMYGAVEEIGNHMPEARLNRDVEIIDVALNG